MKSETVKTCPKTGKKFSAQSRSNWSLILLPITGLLALVWFLCRVIPKPSRATYPCQQMAAPLASAFVAWAIGFFAPATICRQGRLLLHQSRFALGVISIGAAATLLWSALNAAENNPAATVFAPSEPANSPMGRAKGIHPGRVVWVHNADATSWDGSTGNWWDDRNTDQQVVDAMVSSALTGLTGKASDAEAWDALFRDFNQTRGVGNAGYQKPEKIAIKVNMNQDSGRDLKPDAGIPSPQVVYAVVHQLIKSAGVPGSAITIYDATRYIGDPIYNKIRNNPDPDFQAVTFVVSPKSARNGRVAAIHDVKHPLQTKAGTVYLPQCLTEAKYLINLALLRAHSLCGVTLCAKNHFGTTYFPDNGGWTPQPLHNTSNRRNPMGSYNCLVDLNGHEQTGGKTLLYLIDGLYPAKNQSSGVIRFASFGQDWFSSILASQDMVAIDSVGLDFLRHEQTVNPVVTDVVGHPDNYLHEAAMADHPPSGTSYDPEGDGTAMKSLGVHEHWNNPVDRKYSRNLGTGKGIELVAR
jgi:uncharacterized protein (DUF362 family)